MVNIQVVSIDFTLPRPRRSWKKSSKMPTNSFLAADYSDQPLDMSVNRVIRFSYATRIIWKISLGGFPEQKTLELRQTCNWDFFWIKKRGTLKVDKSSEPLESQGPSIRKFFGQMYGCPKIPTITNSFFGVFNSYTRFGEWFHGWLSTHWMTWCQRLSS